MYYAEPAIDAVAPSTVCFVPGAPLGGAQLRFTGANLFGALLADAVARPEAEALLAEVGAAVAAREAAEAVAFAGAMAADGGGALSARLAAALPALPPLAATRTAGAPGGPTDVLVQFYRGDARTEPARAWAELEYSERVVDLRAAAAAIAAAASGGTGKLGGGGGGAREEEEAVKIGHYAGAVITTVPDVGELLGGSAAPELPAVAPSLLEAEAALRAGEAAFGAAAPAPPPPYAAALAAAREAAAANPSLLNARFSFNGGADWLPAAATLTALAPAASHVTPALAALDAAAGDGVACEIAGINLAAAPAPRVRVAALLGAACEEAPLGWLPAAPGGEGLRFTVPPHMVAAALRAAAAPGAAAGEEAAAAGAAAAGGGGECAEGAGAAATAVEAAAAAPAAAPAAQWTGALTLAFHLELSPGAPLPAAAPLTITLWRGGVAPLGDVLVSLDGADGGGCALTFPLAPPTFPCVDGGVPCTSWLCETLLAGGTARSGLRPLALELLASPWAPPGAASGECAPTPTALPISLPAPGDVSALVAPVGGLPPGRYAFALRLTAGGEELAAYPIPGAALLFRGSTLSVVAVAMAPSAKKFTPGAECIATVDGLEAMFALPPPPPPPPPPAAAAPTPAKGAPPPATPAKGKGAPPPATASKPPSAAPSAAPSAPPSPPKGPPPPPPMPPAAEHILVRVTAAAGDGKGGPPAEAVVPAAIAHGGVAFALPAGDAGGAIAGAGEKGKEGEALVALSVDGGKSWSAAAQVKMVKK